MQLGCASGNNRSTGLCWHVPYLAGPDPCSQAPAATGPGAQSAAAPAAPPPLLLLPADLMRYDRPPGPGSVVGGAGMGPAVLLKNGLPGAVLGVPGLLLLLLTLTIAMLWLVCAKPPICSRSMRFCRHAGCGTNCSALGDELMSMPFLSASSAALSEDAAATAASGVWGLGWQHTCAASTRCCWNFWLPPADRGDMGGGCAAAGMSRLLSTPCLLLMACWASDCPSAARMSPASYKLFPNTLTSVTYQQDA